MRYNNSTGRAGRRAGPAHHLYHFLVPEATFIDDKGGPPEGLVRNQQDNASQLGPADNNDDGKKEETCWGKAATYVDSMRQNVPVPQMGAILDRLHGCLVNCDKKGEQKDPPKSGKSAWADEIPIPSVAELARLGVWFEPTEKSIAGIKFDPATAKLTLPIVKLNGYTEVVLHNLVAYEAMAVRGPLKLARYTELMNGIIDAPKDVEILRESGVVVSYLKSDEEAADMWNGMCRATQQCEVPKLDETIDDVNEYYKTWSRVGAHERLKKYMFESWRMLSLLAAIVMLLMMAMQTFCSAYPCTKWFGVLKILQVGGTQ